MTREAVVTAWANTKKFWKSLLSVLWHWGLSCEQSQEAVCKTPAAVTHTDLAGAEQGIWAGLEPGAALWQTLGKKLPGSHTCRHRGSFPEVTWQPWTGEPSMDAKVPALQQECKSPLQWKEKALMDFKPGWHSKALGFEFASLSSLILQPAQKGKQVPWKKRASNSCTKKIIKQRGFGSPDSHHNSIKVVPCPLF